MESSIHYASSSAASTLGTADPIADAIALLRPLPVITRTVHAAGSWAVRFDPFPHVSVGGVASGTCWLTLEGHDPVLLNEGDFYLLGNPPPYVLASDPGARPDTTETSWEGAAQGTLRFGPEAEEDLYVCGGFFAFPEEHDSLLTDVLPPLVHVPAGDPRGTTLANLSALLVSEVGTAAAGRSMVLDHLAQIIFVHMLRAHANHAERPAGWLGALRDDQLGAALRAMHGDVSRRWTLDELASLSSMSRSAFAERFKRQVGVAPLEYLIEWRMTLAREALRRGDRSISELTTATGYRSESAFSTAFRRVVGSSPSQFRNASRRATAAGDGALD